MAKRWGLYSQPNVQSKVCSQCQKELPIESFRVRRKKSADGSQWYPYYNPDCRDCESERRKSYTRTEHYRAKRRRYKEENRRNIRYHVVMRINQWRGKTSDSDLTTDYLVDLFNNQEGLCYYSGVPLVIGAKTKADPHSLSLDRLDPGKGYVQGNVAWCSYLVNTMKQTMTEQEFYGFLQQILRYRGLMM